MFLKLCPNNTKTHINVIVFVSKVKQMHIQQIWNENETHDKLEILGMLLAYNFDKINSF